MSERRGKPGTSGDMDLPPYMEARPMKRGGFTYRVQLEDGKKVALGWHLQDALKEYQKLRGRFDDSDQSASEILTRHKKGARQRSIEFSLTLKDVEAMLQEQAFRCAVTHRNFSNKIPTGQRIRPWAASIDRKDSDGAYTRANCRLVCAAVNIALNRFGDKFFTEILEAMVRRVVQTQIAEMGFGIPMGTLDVPARQLS